jgi:hypothetical protein
MRQFPQDRGLISRGDALGGIERDLVLPGSVFSQERVRRHPGLAKPGQEQLAKGLPLLEPTEREGPTEIAIVLEHELMFERTRERKTGLGPQVVERRSRHRPQATFPDLAIRIFDISEHEMKAGSLGSEIDFDFGRGRWAQDEIA